MNYVRQSNLLVIGPAQRILCILGCQSNLDHKETSLSNFSVNVENNGELVEKNNCYLTIIARLRKQKERHGGDVNNFFIGDRSR
jgi:hypothetical protein